MGDLLTLGAVAYDPKVVTIWDGFRAWLREAGLPFDYVLYSHYERQVEDLLAGRIDAAWNSPLAAIRALRMAAAQGRTLDTVVMRDTDQELTSVVVVAEGSDIGTVEELQGRVIATGAIDSPQATLLPLAHLVTGGLALEGPDVATVRRFDVGVGLHGDHIGGERDAARALAAGEVDAACMIDANLLLFQQEGVLGSGVRVLAQSSPYDHCTMTVADTAPPELAKRFTELLLAMSYDDPAMRVLLDLEGLHEWRPGRTSGYAALEAAVDLFGFYDADGRVTMAGYAP